MFENMAIKLDDITFNENVWSLAIDVDLGDKPPKEIQLFPLGSWKHPKGEFTVNENVVNELIDNFNKSPNDVVIDYEHQSMSGNKAPAAGWVKKLVNKGEKGLWAIVDWTKKGAEYIKNREYRYISPAFAFNAMDKITGKKIGARLLSVAVTNTPYLEGMQPLFLKEDHIKKEKDMDELLKMLGLKEGAKETEIIAAINALKAPVNKALGLKDDASADEALKAIKALCEPINKELGLKEDAGSDEAVTAIKALSEKKGDPPTVAGEILTALELSETGTVADVMSKITELKKDPDKQLEERVRTLTEKIALSEAKELVDKYTKQGKLVPATREFDLKDAVRDPKAFSEKMEKSPVIVTPGSVDTKSEDPTLLSEDQKSVNALMDVSDEDYKKYA